MERKIGLRPNDSGSAPAIYTKSKFLFFVRIPGRNPAVLQLGLSVFHDVSCKSFLIVITNVSLVNFPFFSEMVHHQLDIQISCFFFFPLIFVCVVIVPIVYTVTISGPLLSYVFHSSAL